jgi:hypothetical protein
LKKAVMEEFVKQLGARRAPSHANKLAELRRLAA